MGFFDVPSGNKLNRPLPIRIKTYFCPNQNRGAIIMTKKIKLIWDFRGSDARKTARHHAIHLKEFSEREKINTFDIGEETMSNMHCIAYMIVEEKDMINVRDALKPHRGQLAE